MFDFNELRGALAQYAGDTGSKAPEQVHNDFDQVSRGAPPEALAEGLSYAFRSDQTPHFGQMVSNLFRNGDGEQKAGLLGTLVSALGPSGVASGGGPLSGLMGMLGGGQTSINPQQAQQVPPETVEQLARHAQSQNPSVVDEVSHFLSQHPGWVKSLGSTALSLVLSKVAERHFLHV